MGGGWNVLYQTKHFRTFLWHSNKNYTATLALHRHQRFFSSVHVFGGETKGWRNFLINFFASSGNCKHFSFWGGEKNKNPSWKKSMLPRKKKEKERKTIPKIDAMVRCIAQGGICAKLRESWDAFWFTGEGNKFDISSHQYRGTLLLNNFLVVKEAKLILAKNL